jgi:hypothetical protein
MKKIDIYFYISTDKINILKMLYEKNKEKFQHLIPKILYYFSFRYYNLDTFTYFFNCQDKQSPKFIEKYMSQ